MKNEPFNDKGMPEEHTEARATQNGQRIWGQSNKKSNQKRSQHSY